MALAWSVWGCCKAVLLHPDCLGLVQSVIAAEDLAKWDPRFLQSQGRSPVPSSKASVRGGVRFSVSQELHPGGLKIHVRTLSEQVLRHTHAGVRSVLLLRVRARDRIRNDDRRLQRRALVQFRTSDLGSACRSLIGLSTHVAHPSRAYTCIVLLATCLLLTEISPG